MFLRAVLLILCSAICTPQYAQKKKSPALFTVNGKPVTAEEFVYLYRKNHQNNASDYTEEKIREYFDLYVNFKLKVEEARQRGMDTTAAFRREYNQYKDELRKPYLPGNGLTDSLVKLTYDRLKEEIRASHLLISVKQDASPADTAKAFNKIIDLRNRIVQGEDFATLASQFSEDPSAKMNRGDLGYFTAMQMVYPFEQAAYSTPVGSVSQPVRTRFGYHILKVYDRRPSRGEVEVSHILLRTNADKSNDDLKNKIFNIYDELQAGASWNELCKQYSDDLSTKDNGGKLHPFGTGVMNNIPEFERVAFELQRPGDISDPFQSQYGWHIVKLERKLPLAPFPEMASALRSKVSRDERTQISQDALQKKMRLEYGLKENPAVKAKLMALADTSLQKGRWKPKIAQPEETLFTLTNEPFPVKAFVSYVFRNQRSTSEAPAAYLSRLYDGFVDEMVMKKLEEGIMAKNPQYKYLLNEYYEGILLFEIMEKEVWTKASEDSLGQKKYYTEHLDKYQAGERVRAVIYSTADEAILANLPALLEEGDVRKVQEYVSQNKVKSESGYYQKSDKAVLNQVPWAQGIHRAQLNNVFYLIWIKQVLDPGQMSFEEARIDLVSDYQNHLEAQWIASLKKKYPIKVNEKLKKATFDELLKNQKN